MPLPIDAPFPDDRPEAIVAAVEAAIGAALPEACRDGVVENARLLRRHWATLGEAEFR